MNIPQTYDYLIRARCDLWAMLDLRFHLPQAAH